MREPFPAPVPPGGIEHPAVLVSLSLLLALAALVARIASTW